MIFVFNVLEHAVCIDILINIKNFEKHEIHLMAHIFHTLVSVMFPRLQSQLVLRSPIHPQASIEGSCIACH